MKLHLSRVLQWGFYHREAALESRSGVLVQYNGVFTTVKLHLSRVLEK